MCGSLYMLALIYTIVVRCLAKKYICGLDNSHLWLHFLGCQHVIWSLRCLANFWLFSHMLLVCVSVCRCISAFCGRWITKEWHPFSLMNLNPIVHSFVTGTQCFFQVEQTLKLDTSVISISSWTCAVIVSSLQSFPLPYSFALAGKVLPWCI